MAQRPTSAIVLSAGFGTRMRPLTDTTPKPLVPLAGRALLDHVLDRLVQAGVTRAVVNVHYLADQIVEHVQHRKAPDISISDERDRLLDTGGGIAKALPMLGDGDTPFIAHNSDSVWIEPTATAPNLDRLIAAWEADMDCLLLLADRAASVGYRGRGDFELDSDGTVSWGEQGAEKPYVYAGVAIIHPRLFRSAPSGPFSLVKLWDEPMREKRLRGIVLDGQWMHVGDPGSLQQAERCLADDAAS